MIEVDNVSKRYSGGYDALQDISFKVKTGEMLFITGHSGAGKTTLLKLLAGIEFPSKGRLIINGNNFSELKANAIPYIRRNFGLIFQDHKLLFDRNVYDNIALPLIISNYPIRQIGKRVRASLNKVGLLNKEKAMPISLSGGEQQRLCIARAIINRPAILLADEPTANLDRDYAKEIMNIFDDFNKVGVTVVVATHDTPTILESEHKALILKSGQLDR